MAWTWLPTLFPCMGENPEPRRSRPKKKKRPSRALTGGFHSWLLVKKTRPNIALLRLGSGWRGGGARDRREAEVLSPCSDAVSWLQSGFMTDRSLDDALAAMRAGRLDEARERLEPLLAAEPNKAALWHHSAGLALKEGRPETALEHFKTAITLQPGNALYRADLASHLLKQGQAEAAVKLLQAVPLQGPGWILATMLLGHGLARLQRMDEALAAYDRILSEETSHPGAQRSKAVALAGCGRSAEAVALLTKAHHADPDNRVTVVALARLLFRVGRGQEADKFLVAQAQRSQAPAHFLARVARRWAAEDEPQLAYVAIRRALEADPNDAAIASTAGALARRLGRRREALGYLQQAMRLNPEAAASWNNLANLQGELGHYQDAAHSYARAAELSPDDPVIPANQCRLLLEAGQIDAAAEAAARALNPHARRPLPPDQIPLPLSLAALLYDPVLEEAESAILWQGLDRLPQAAIPQALGVLGPLAATRDHQGQVNRLQGRWAARLASQALHTPLPPLSAPAKPKVRRYRSVWRVKKGEKLRLGILAVDAGHPLLARHLFPFLRHLDRQEVEPLLYAAWPPESAPAAEAASTEEALSQGAATRARLQRILVRGITTVVPIGRDLKSRALAERMREDGLDILLSLDGMGPATALPALAWRGAQVQIGWLGPLTPLHIPTLDWWLLDPVLAAQAGPEGASRSATPQALVSGAPGAPGAPDAPGLAAPEGIEAGQPGQQEAVASLTALPGEKPLCLPECWVCLDAKAPEGPFPDRDPAAMADRETDLPLQSNGYPTFASFAEGTRCSPAVLEAWAQILRAVPGARLAFLRPEAASPRLRAHLSALFQQQGIDPDRLLFSSAWIEGRFADAFAEVDILLDPFPQGCGARLLEPLWFGVPVISLAGHSPAARQGASLLQALGLSDLAPETIEGYVAAATTLAGQEERLRDLRQGLRQTLLASPLGKPEAFTKSMESVLKSTLGQALKA